MKAISAWKVHKVAISLIHERLAIKTITGVRFFFFVVFYNKEFNENMKESRRNVGIQVEINDTNNFSAGWFPLKTLKHGHENLKI